VTGGRARGLCAAVVAFAIQSSAAAAQRVEPEGGRPRLEARLDAMLTGDASTIHAGVGLERALSRYARLAGVLAGGSVSGDGAATAFSARADALVRFVLDPLAEQPRSPYAVGGVSVRRERDQTRGDLVALVGLQLRRRGDHVPAVELGFGGGVRLGVVLRRVR
jgi:hypothetical protein